MSDESLMRLGCDHTCTLSWATLRRNKAQCCLTFELPSSVTPLFLLCFVLSTASIAIRRLIGVTEVKKTGSSYGDQEAKKQNWRASPPPPPSVYDWFQYTRSAVSHPYPTPFSYCSARWQVRGRDPTVKRIIETRVRNTNSPRVRDSGRESMKGLGVKLSGVTQNMMGRYSTVFQYLY